MNADDRTTTSTRGLYTPRPTEPTTGQVPSRRAFMPVGDPTAEAAPVSGQTPTRTPVTGQTPTASSAAPSTGSIPQRTALRPQSTPGGIPTTAQPAPAREAAQPQAFSPTGAPAAAPTTEPSRLDGAVGAGTAAIGAGAAKVKGLAGRAAESFKAGDDLAVPTSKGGPRKARVLMSRIDPWSVLKLGFLLSIAAGIMLVVGVFVLWNVLNGMGIFALVNEWVVKLFAQDSEIDIMQFFDRNKVMSATILVSVVNVVLLTALATIGAFLYNVVSSVVGGVYVTLTDD
ncbi:DUF3566 domain-containing protein [Demequina sp. SYSU T00192]|uniref:DUF3566 domain-containing protein n=1 Tax=Demequina litoralis TaxID=3051660 RepID=A0ABT8GAF7_9MICO|nr:DUF3566 domain-containing protein [Demequina sp. SYSU T00192]MDN4476116.1 DUF3566 domain-containing protein [Demequina sp. SYSU T00192]